MAREGHEKRPSIGTKIRVGTPSRIGTGVVIGHVQLQKGGEGPGGGHEPFIVQITEWQDRNTV